MFRTRIELKQIGVRDEAKRLGGIGRCGREYCSASWLPELRPVNLGVAKDQRLSLNPAQISGACGRLMCCLRYEHEFYVQSRKRFPKEAKVLVTAHGEEKVVANDIFNERVTLRNVEGETRVVSLADLKREMTGGPMTVEEPTVEEEPDMMLELDEEVIRMTDTAERPAYRPGWRPGMPGFPTPGERPVTLQRRETKGPGEGSPETGDETKVESGSRDQARRPGAHPPAVRQPQARDGQAAAGGEVSGSTGFGPGSSGAAGTDAAPGGTAESPPRRRRRGRRGGRRGRRSTDSGTLPNAGLADASADVPEDTGDDGEGDE
jgi:hypothetical protein